MKSFMFLVAAAVLSIALAVVAAATPGYAMGLGTEASSSTVDLTGEVTTVGDQPTAASAVRLFHVPGAGYLPVDFAATPLDRSSVGTITVRLAVPVGVDVSGATESPFAALARVGSPIAALDIMPQQQSRVAAMVNQTPTVAGPHHIFAVSVTPANVGGSWQSASQSTANIQADVANADAYWRSQSDGRVGFDLVGVTAWYRSSINCSVSLGSNFYNLVAEASAHATAELGYSDGPNNHLALFFPAGSGCGGAVGVGTIGSSANSGGALWAVGTQSLVAKQTLAHELGHNLSLGHASWLDCSSAEPNPGVTGTNGCTKNEYGDLADVMGYGFSTSSGGSLSSAQAVRSGLWSSGSFVNAPQGTGTYTLNALSTAAGLRSVVVEDGDGANYFIEFRDKDGIDAPTASLAQPCAATYCTSTTAGVRVLRLEAQQYAGGYYYKGFWGDASELIGRTVEGQRKTTYVTGESFTLNGVVVAVTAMTDSTATVTVTRPVVTATAGLIDIWCTVCSPASGINVGDTLTGMLDSSWVADSYRFQWYRNGVAISGATAQSYTIAPADAGALMKVRAVSTTAGRTSGMAADPADPAIGYGPVVVSTILPGTVTIDASAGPLTAVVDGWFPDGVSYSFQWLRNGAPIARATAQTYTPTLADDRAMLAVAVTGSKVALTSATRSSVAGDYSLVTGGPAVVGGTPQLGQRLIAPTLTYAKADGTPVTPTLTYQWYRSGVAIAGATNSGYILALADVSKVMTVAVLASQAGCAPHRTVSSSTGVVQRPSLAMLFRSKWIRFAR